MLIIHTANIFLDKPFFSSSKPSFSIRRRELQREVFSRIVAIALERKADVVCIAGNLLDPQCVTDDTLAWVSELLDHLSPFPVCIVPSEEEIHYGIYDYCKDKFPNNVKVFLSPDGELWTPGGLPMPILGFPGTISIEKLQSLKSRLGGGKYILLTYDVQTNNSISLDKHVVECPASFLPFVYIALGKKPMYVKCASNPTFGMYYCGLPNPMDFSDEPPFGILGVRLSQGEKQWSLEQVEHIPTATCSYSNVKIECTGDMTFEQILGILKSKLNILEPPKVVQILFTGTLSLFTIRQIPEILNQLSADCEDILCSIQSEVYELKSMCLDNPNFTFTQFFNRLYDEWKQSPTPEIQGTLYRAIVLALSAYHQIKLDIPISVPEKEGLWN